MAGLSKCCIASSVPDHVRITHVTKHPQFDHGPRFNQYFCFECFQVMLNNQKMDKVFLCNRLAPIMHQETSKQRSVLSCCAIRNPPKWPTFLPFSPSFRRIWIQKTTMKTRVVLRLNWSRWIVGKNMEKLVTDTLKVFHQEICMIIHLISHALPFLILPFHLPNCFQWHRKTSQTSIDSYFPPKKHQHIK